MRRATGKRRELIQGVLGIRFLIRRGEVHSLRKENSPASGFHLDRSEQPFVPA